jgi:pyruvate,orthophosphate dikinase
VWANADYPRDARRALEYGAQGIGLCRTEHMFFETDRLPHFQQDDHDRLPRRAARGTGSAAAVPAGGFRRPVPGHGGPPVIIRLIDPPLHEFLPDLVELVSELADLKIRLKHATDMAAIDALLAMKSAKKSSCASGPRACGRPTPCWACGGCVWASTFRS